jgi:hypothetical protein
MNEGASKATGDTTGKLLDTVVNADVRVGYDVVVCLRAIRAS